MRLSKKTDLESFILTLLHYAILVYAIFYLLLDPSNLYASFLLILIFLSILIVNSLLKLPRKYFALILLGAYLGMLGEYFGGNLYQILPYYDKFLHFVNAFALTFIVYDLLKERKLLATGEFFSLLSVMGVGALFEIVEYFIDLFIHPLIPMQGVVNPITHILDMSPLQDTMLDLSSALVGSVIAVIILFFINRKLKKK